MPARRKTGNYSKSRELSLESWRYARLVPKVIRLENKVVFSRYAWHKGVGSEATTPQLPINGNSCFGTVARKDRPSLVVSSFAPESEYRRECTPPRNLRYEHASRVATTNQRGQSYE